MNRNSISKIAKSLAIFTISILALSACKKPDNSIGTNFLEGEMFNTGIYRNTKLMAFTSENNKIETSSASKSLLGAYRDEVFGMTRASYGIQLKLQQLSPSFGTNAVVDSVILTMPYLGRGDNRDIKDSEGNVIGSEAFTNYETDSIYGDRTIPMHIQISELDKLLRTDSTYYSTVDLPITGSPLYENMNFVSYLDSLTLYGHNRDGSNKDTLKIPASFRVHLDKDYFQTNIIDMEGSAALASEANFIDYFNGLSFSTTSNNGAVYSFDMLSGSSLVIYYKNDDLDDDDELLSPQSFNLLFSSELSRANKYEFDRSTITDPNSTLIAQLNGDTLNGSDALFLQGMSGLEGNLMLFTDDDQLKGLRDSSWLINDASLIYRVSDDNENAVAPPFRIYMFNRDSMYSNNWQITDDIYENGAFDGNLRNDPKIFSGEDRYYKFRITNHIDEILNGIHYTDIKGEDSLAYGPNYPIKIISTTGKESPSRVKLNSDKASTVNPDAKNLYLEIHYSKKEQDK